MKVRTLENVRDLALVESVPGRSDRRKCHNCAEPTLFCITL